MQFHPIILICLKICCTAVIIWSNPSLSQPIYMWTYLLLQHQHHQFILISQVSTHSLSSLESLQKIASKMRQFCVRNRRKILGKCAEYAWKLCMCCSNLQKKYLRIFVYEILYSIKKSLAQQCFGIKLKHDVLFWVY